MRKRHRFIRNIILLTLLGLVIGCEAGVSDSPDRVICENLSSFYQLWKDSGYGRDPNRTEKAAWVVQGFGGSYAFKRWPSSGARNREIWKGSIPANAVAQVHTHTAIVDEAPSHADARAAQKLQIVIYVISNKGIWSVAPDGRKEKQADERWHMRGCYEFHRNTDEPWVEASSYLGKP